MARFHSLTVTDVHKTIADAVVLTLQPDDPEAFDFIQGQYLTFRRDFDGEELRRSYSICAGRDDGVLQVGIKRVDGGAFSTWANTALQVGDTLEAMPPMGTFHAPIEGAHYLGFAGGSGITPLLSTIRTVLDRAADARFTLVYANRAVNTIMFRAELEDLKNRYMERLNVIHILEQDALGIDLFIGRVDGEKCAALFKHWINLPSVKTAFICGPEPMMLAISQALKTHGLVDDQIKFELFASGQPGRAKLVARSADADEKPDVAATVTLDGEQRQFAMSRNVSLLQAALDQNLEAPYACRAGVCSTCKCKVLCGAVEMQANHALEDDEVSAGYVLSCQAYPITDEVTFDYDSASH